MKPVLLVDCDGVLGDFVGVTFDIVEQLTGTRPEREALTDYGIIKSLGLEHIEPDIREQWAQPGLCASIKPLQGAQNAMTELQRLASVYVVTTPMHTPTWCHERTDWLARHFKLEHSRIIYAKDKHLVRGDVFIDDHLNNAIKWQQHNGPRRTAVIWDQPWNRNSPKPDGLLRTCSWSRIIEIVKNTANTREALSKGIFQ